MLSRNLRLSHCLSKLDGNGEAHANMTIASAALKRRRENCHIQVAQPIA